MKAYYPNMTIDFSGTLVELTVEGGKRYLPQWSDSIARFNQNITDYLLGSR